MPPLKNTPDIYIEESLTRTNSIAQVETAIPAFIGYTGFARDASGNTLTNKPKRITSLSEYERYYGFPQPEEITITLTDEYLAPGVLSSRNIAARLTREPSRHIMYYQLQMFFANGGRACYVVSVGDYLTHGSIIDASDAGALANGLKLLESVEEPAMLVIPELVVSGAMPKDIYGLYSEALAQCSRRRHRFTLMDCAGDDYTTLRHNSDGIGMLHLRYGAAYHPFLNTQLQYHFTDNLVTIEHILTGRHRLRPDYQGATLEHLKERDAALYGLCITGISQLKVTLPPSAAIAGIYAQVDGNMGVWKSPANIRLTGVNSVTRTISNFEQGRMNTDTTSGKSVNAIRAFSGKGILVWGSRTLAGNDNEWRYVSVGRFVMMVEESIRKSLESFVFEPNVQATWDRIKSLVEDFLQILWRQGAMQGIKPELAFYVRIGTGSSMTAIDVAEGRMILETGIAAIRPAEFIPVRIAVNMVQP